MLKRYSFILIFGILALAGCARREKAPERIPQDSDTLYTARAAMMVYGKEPERALNIIDSALIVGNISSYEADFLRAKVYIHTLDGSRMDEAIALCQDLLQRDSTRLGSSATETNRSNVLQLLMDASRYKNDDEHWIQYAVERAELNRRRGKETEALRMEAEIGAVLTQIGRTEEGMVKLEQVIRALDQGAPSIDRMDAGIVARKRRIFVYEEAGRYKEMIQDAEAILHKLADYQSRPGDYAEDSFRLPPIEEDRARYCRFYTTQAWAYLARAYANTQLPEARKYARQVEESDFGQSFSVRHLLVPVWKSLGEWDKVIAFDDEAELRIGTDTLTTDFANLLLDRADAAKAQGKYPLALSYMDRYTRLREQLEQMRREGEAQEFAARYRAMEQERRIQEEKERADRKDSILVFVSIVLIIIVAFAVVALLQRRSISRKNHVLVNIISELSVARASSRSDAPKPDQKQFALIDGTVRKERLYANKNLQRQDIIDRFDISRHSLNSLFTAFADGQSFSAYINGLRLEEAVRLLHDEPDLSIGEIAETVGFTPHNFREQFKRQYGMTPSEYRENIS